MISFRAATATATMTSVTTSPTNVHAHVPILGIEPATTALVRRTTP